MFEGHGEPSSIFIAALNVLRGRIFVIKETRRVKEKGQKFSHLLVDPILYDPLAWFSSLL